MKTDFSINVQINIGVTDEVVQLVTAILQNRTTVGVVEQPAIEAPTEKTPRERSKKTADPKPAEAATDQPAEAATDQPEETHDPEPEPEAEDPGKKELTEEDVREAMDRTRRRIEGEDYKENTAGELYKKYHKQLTATFKNISALLGSDKPSALPADKRADFISECDLLIVNDKGEIAKPEAF